MAGRVVSVADTSVFIALDRIGRLELLDQLFERVVIVPAVLAELTPRPLQLVRVIRTPRVEVDAEPPVLHPATSGLGSGERQVISYAIARALPLVLLDEKSARARAKMLGLHARGVLGILARDRREKLIPDLRGPIGALLDAGFRPPLSVANEYLVASGEEPVGPAD